MDSKQVTAAVLGTIVKIIVMAVIVLGIYKMAVFAYDFGFRIFAEPAMDVSPGHDVTVTVEVGQDSKDVGKMLEEKGLVQSARLFAVQELFSEHKAKIQPGVYTLNTSQTAEEMLAVLAEVKEDAAEESDLEGNSDLPETGSMQEQSLSEDAAGDEINSEETGY